MKKVVPTIEVKKFFPSFIASREAADFITQKLIEKLLKSKNKEAILDFRSINFISRSFADEILDSIEKLERREIKIKTKNLNPAVSKMLNLVKAQRRRILKQSSIRLPSR